MHRRINTLRHVTFIHRSCLALSYPDALQLKSKHLVQPQLTFRHVFLSYIHRQKRVYETTTATPRTVSIKKKLSLANKNRRGIFTGETKHRGNRVSQGKLNR